MKTNILIFIIFIFHCSLKIRNQNKLTDLDSNFSNFFLIDTLTNFQASGDIKLSLNGERFTGKIDIILKEKDNFELTVYNTLSMIIANLRSYDDSVFIKMGESTYVRCLSDTISSLSFFPPVPFNFSDLIRILTGRILQFDCVLMEIKLSSGNNINFQCDSLAFSVMLSKNKLKVKSINCTFSHNNSSWSTDFSKFRNGFGEKIEIKSNNSDNLILKLNVKKYIL